MLGNLTETLTSYFLYNAQVIYEKFHKIRSTTLSSWSLSSTHENKPITVYTLGFAYQIGAHVRNVRSWRKSCKLIRYMPLQVRFWSSLTSTQCKQRLKTLLGRRFGCRAPKIRLALYHGIGPWEQPIPSDDLGRGQSDLGTQQRRNVQVFASHDGNDCVEVVGWKYWPLGQKHCK